MLCKIIPCVCVCVCDLPHSCGASEGHFPHNLTASQSRTNNVGGVSAGCHHIEHTRWKPSFVRELEREGEGKSQF